MWKKNNNWEWSGKKALSDDSIYIYIYIYILMLLP